MGFSDNDSESDSDVEAGDARKDSVASDVSFASYICVDCSALCENGLIASKFPISFIGWEYLCKTYLSCICSYPIIIFYMLSHFLILTKIHEQLSNICIYLLLKQA